MTIKRPQIGDFVKVIFWDHCENFHDAMQFEAYGKITKITPKAYVLYTWQYHDHIQRAKDPDPEKNENCFCIVKKAVDSIKIFK